MRGRLTSPPTFDYRSMFPFAPRGSSSSPKSAETFPCTSITRWDFSSSASRAVVALRSGRREDRPACAREGARAPSAHPGRAACATPSGARYRGPPGAAARRSHQAGCTPPPRARPAACTRPRSAAAVAARPARDRAPPRARLARPPLRCARLRLASSRRPSSRPSRFRSINDITCSDLALRTQ